MKDKDRYIIKNYTNIFEKDWDIFVTKNSMGYVYHLYKMMFIDEDFMSMNVSFAIEDTIMREIVLLMPLYLKISNSQDFKNELISRCGFVIKDGLTVKARNNLSRVFIEYLNYILKKYDINDFYTEIPSLCTYNRPKETEVINPLIFFGFEPHIRYTWVVDLSKDKSRILSDCESTTRQAIRKYLFSDEYIFCETNEYTKFEDVDTIIDLSEDTYNRSFGKSKSREYYRNMVLNLDSAIRRIFLIKRKIDNSPIVFAVITIYKDTAHYSLGASVKEKPIGISKYLMYCIMLELKKSQIKYFEIGGAYPYLTSLSKKRGISDFKKCFGTFLHTIHRGHFIQTS